jgi:hypothetical protein
VSEPSPSLGSSRTATNGGPFRLEPITSSSYAPLKSELLPSPSKARGSDNFPNDYLNPIDLCNSSDDEENVLLDLCNSSDDEENIVEEHPEKDALDAEAHPSEKRSPEGEVSTEQWCCTRCNHFNKKSRCGNCLAWKDGKRPKKLSNSYEPKTSSNKKELKPLFARGDEVFARCNDCNDDESDWFPGIIDDFITVKDGPTRQYRVRFDENDEVSGYLDEHIVWSKTDYLLSTALNRPKKWIGVKSVVDKNSSDLWAKFVGWYQASIGKNR